MADETSHVSKTIEDMRTRVAATLELARTQLAALNGTEAMYGVPLTQWSDVLGGTSNGAPAPPLANSGAPVTMAVSPPRRGGNPQALHLDEYLGDEPMDAAKKYMRLVGHATPFDEIADAVQRGGAALQGADWRDRLELSLKRSPYQVITVSDHTYALSEFYAEEQLKRFRGSKKSDVEPSAKKKSKGRRKAKSKPVAPAKKSEAPAVPTPAKKKAESAATVTELAPRSDPADPSAPVH